MIIKSGFYDIFRIEKDILIILYDIRNYFKRNKKIAVLVKKYLQNDILNLIC